MDKLDMLKYLKNIKEKCGVFNCCCHHKCLYYDVCADEMNSSPCEMYDDLIALLNFEKRKKEKNND